MYRLSWSDIAERYYEFGCDRGVLYVGDGDGVPWNGLISVEQSPSGGTSTPYYVDGIKYLTVGTPEEFEGTITAFSSPEEFDECDGALGLSEGLLSHHQLRAPFGLSYRTMIGNGRTNSPFGYRIHLVYNALANPAPRTYETISDNPSAIPLSWNFTTTPIFRSNIGLPTSHFTIDSTKTHEWVLSEIEKIIYGSEYEPARLPYPDEVAQLYTYVEDLKAWYNDDGETLSIEGPDEVLSQGLDELTVEWPTVDDLDTHYDVHTN